MTRYVTAQAVALFLAPSGSPTDLCGALAIGRDAGLRVGCRIGGAVPKADPATGAPLPLLPCPFVAIVLAGGVDDALHALLDRAAAHIDLGASAALIGVEHTVMPGDGAVMAVMLVNRRADFTRAAFRARWLGEHARFGLASKAAGYR